MQWLLDLIKLHALSLLLIAISIVIFIAAFLVMRFRYPYQSAKKHGFIIANIALIIAIIYALELYAHFSELQSWIGIADNIFSGSIFAILCFLFLGVEKRIKNHYEDAEKLRQDYDVLSQKYIKNNLVQAVNDNGSNVTYPVIKLGIGSILLKKDENKQIIISDSPYDYYQLPTIIENHYSSIFSIHDTSKIYNNLNIRVKSMTLNNNQLELITMRTTYFDSLVTNRASDYNFSEGLTVRELFETGPRMTPLERSRLSNHLGFNGFVESCDGYIVLVKRSGDLSIGKRTYGDSIGASLKTRYALDEDGIFNYQGLRTAIIEEIFDELKINMEDIDQDTLSIIASYRDCVECGKPQLLIFARSFKTDAEISTNFTRCCKKKLIGAKKLDKKQRLELEELEDGTKLLWINKNSFVNDIIYCSDHIEIEKVSGKEGFVYFDKSGKKESAVYSLKMVPSASASAYLFKEIMTLPRIIESYICSKYNDQSLCEDGLVICSNVIAVIDGATSKSSLNWNNKSSGRYAMEIIKKALEKGVSTRSPLEFFSALNQALQKAIQLHPKCSIKEIPRASVIAYIADKHEIWSYGDCRCIVGDEYFSHEKQIDIELSKKRASVIEKRLATSDATYFDLEQHDFGRDVIMNDLIHQFKYENRHYFVDGYDYGYPVLNGDIICKDMIKVHKVPHGSMAILASDGYPVLRNTLSDSEAELARIITSDPFCFREYKSTKGLSKECISFDDRTYIRFEV